MPDPLPGTAVRGSHSGRPIMALLEVLAPLDRWAKRWAQRTR